MMGVINFAHSALFMLGAYVGLVATTRLGSFWLGLLIAPPAIGLLGAAMER
jgi:branched-chain amino acid transport system permease protein